MRAVFIYWVTFSISCSEIVWGGVGCYRDSWFYVFVGFDRGFVIVSCGSLGAGVRIVCMVVEGVWVLVIALRFLGCVEGFF